MTSRIRKNQPQLNQVDIKAIIVKPRTRAALHKAILDVLPKELQYPPKEFNEIALTYAASGYNQALTKVKKAIEELFK